MKHSRRISHALTKAQHDQIVGAKGRPVTQDPPHRRHDITYAPNPDSATARAVERALKGDT